MKNARLQSVLSCCSVSEDESQSLNQLTGGQSLRNKVLFTDESQLEMYVGNRHHSVSNPQWRLTSAAVFTISGSSALKQKKSPLYI